MPPETEERSQPATIEIDVLDSLAAALRAGATLEHTSSGLFLLSGPGDHTGAGGKTIGEAVAGYNETLVHREYMRRAKEGD